MTDTLETWTQRVSGSVRVRHPSDAEAIALLCRDAQVKGHNCATWHNASRFYGHEDRCPCAACNPEGTPR